MTRAVWACAICLFLLLLIEWGNYSMNYQYLNSDVPECTPSQEGIVS